MFVGQQRSVVESGEAVKNCLQDITQNNYLFDETQFLDPQNLHLAHSLHVRPFSDSMY